MAIPIFEQMYPNVIAEFVFDQSSAHGAFAKDALNVKDMNVWPGGKQRIMHDTYIPSDNPNPELHGRKQTMIFVDDLPSNHPDYKYRGQQKAQEQLRREALMAAEGGNKPGEM
ncbi:hypothetical protein PAXRUDRAFT_25963 [Paxillus rubicundulus Ve08.2h10]|uniref:Uncharacterized protein n=1 Tax=Paxillus rubicundulus Ve08.2h10 TaxID=930991 RepID=A0A0D0E1S9_9AGAM|nr:hypothetical protein PAXRUDRAFT_25963 [Paxillus rubicundulus Ve08.2h10]